MPDATGKPDNLPLGMINFRVETTRIGETATFEIYLPEIPPESVHWYKIDPVNGWYQYPVQRENDVFVFEITDGGPGDADGVANGIIVDPLGMSYTAGTEPDDSTNVLPVGGGGGGGCFIEISSDLSSFRRLVEGLLRRMGFWTGSFADNQM